MPIEVINLITQGALAAVFFYLYWDAKKRAQEQDDKHDRDIDRLYTLRIKDLQYIAKLPTDLEGNYRLGPDSSVKA